MPIALKLQHQALAACDEGANAADFAHGVFHVIGKGDDVAGVHYQLRPGLHGHSLDGAVGVKEDSAISTL